MPVSPPMGNFPDAENIYEIKSDLPNLQDGEWAKTGDATYSPESRPYNCFAWSLCRNDIGWVYNIVDKWGNNNKIVEIEDFDRFYQSFGYEICGKSIQDCTSKKGLKKIALFCKDEKPQHAAKESKDGWWESKLGNNIKIMHRLEQMEGGYYGNVCRCYCLDSLAGYELGNKLLDKQLNGGDSCDN